MWRLLGCASRSQPSALSLNRLRKRRAEVPAAPARSGPTAFPRRRGALRPWAVTASLETQTPVRAAPQLPVLHASPPSFQPFGPLKSDLGIFVPCPILLLEQ